MALTEAKRNKYRGLQKFMNEHYELKNSSIDQLHEALQLEPRFKGVSYDSVSTAFYNLTKVPAKVSNGLDSSHNFLVTIPMPRRKSITLTWAEAKKMHSDLCGLFGKS